MASKPVSRRLIILSLLVAQVVIALLMVRNWAYVTTYRLYLDRRMGAAVRSIAAQQFDIEGERVVPQIVTHGPDRVAFATAIEAKGSRTDRRPFFKLLDRVRPDSCRIGLRVHPAGWRTSRRKLNSTRMPE